MAGWIKGIILGTQLLSFQKLGLIDKLLLEHEGLPHILDLAVHLVNSFGWMSQGVHSDPLFLLAPSSIGPSGCTIWLAGCTIWLAGCTIGAAICSFCTARCSICAARCIIGAARCSIGAARCSIGAAGCSIGAAGCRIGAARYSIGAAGVALAQLDI